MNRETKISVSKVVSTSTQELRESKKKRKRKKRKAYTSSDCSDSDRERKESKKRKVSISSDSSDSYHHKKKKKHNKHKRKKEKSKKVKNERKTVKPNDSSSIENIDRILLDRAKAMAPMTKEEWDKRQNVVRRVYEKETNRYRLIKGDGEVLEEIVSKERHTEINRKATKGDGEFFQSQVSTLSSR